MDKETIKHGNRLIAEFMGYIYYHKGVDIDNPDCGGLYERFEIFSKVPILVKEYPEDDQYYFAEVPNPDYKNENNPQWNPDYETLLWSSVNLGNYIICLDYHNNWNSLMEAINKAYSSIKNEVIEIHRVSAFQIINSWQLKISDSNLRFDKNRIWSSLVEYIKWFNSKKL